MDTPTRLAWGAPAALCPRRVPRVHEQPLGNEVLLCDPGGGRVGVLNRTGYFIWQRCDGHHTVNDIVEALRAGFTGTEAHDVEAHVREALAALCAAGLLMAPGQSEGTYRDP